MSEQVNESTTAPSATTPLLPRSDENDTQKVELKVVQVSPGRQSQQGQASPTPAAAAAPATTDEGSKLVANAPTLSNEYRFVHQRIPPRQGKLRFLLPILLLSFQVLFIVLLAIFGSYKGDDRAKVSSTYPLFSDLHAITLIGFGFLMTFLKRYGYGSVGFNLLLVAFAVQWALIIRGLVDWSKSDANFTVGLDQLVDADFVAVAVLISFGAVLGKTTLTQLVVMAIIEVVLQVVNERINILIFQAYDVGRSVYVHLFGALFGLAVSKFLHCRGVNSSKQASVYHSDLFSLIGTLFLWVYYPSFNGLLAKSAVAEGQSRAIINTYAAISASCVVTFGISSLAGKGKITAMHIQHATIAGGIAIGSVADLNVQIYIALIVGSIAGLLSAVGYQYIEPFVSKGLLKLHDTCGVLHLHVIPGLIAVILGAIFAACASLAEYSNGLYQYYPARAPSAAETDLASLGISRLGTDRTAAEQAGFQLAAAGVTIALALVGGALTGLLLRVRVFEQLSEEVEMFDDEAQWITPDDYALKLTFATSQPNEKKDDTKV
jgi:ammonium transporter Rh